MNFCCCCYYWSYEDSLKYYRDLKNSLDKAEADGIVKGIEIVAIEMIKVNEPDLKIQQFTGLTTHQINELRKKLINSQ